MPESPGDAAESGTTYAPIFKPVLAGDGVAVGAALAGDVGRTAIEAADCCDPPEQLEATMARNIADRRLGRLPSDTIPFRAKA
jgi:hypothetical protein